MTVEFLCKVYLPSIPNPLYPEVQMMVCWWKIMIL